MPKTTRSWPYASRFLLVTIVAVGLTACGPGNDRDRADTAADTAVVVVPPAAETPTTEGAATALSTPQVAEILSESDSAVIVPSKLALQKGQEASVKAYAERMIRDHGMMEDSLRAMEQRENITPMPSPISQEIQRQAEAAMKQLETLSGSEFDQAYIESMIQLHQGELSLIDDQVLPATQDQKLRQVITERVRPLVSSHLQEAQQIQQSLATNPGSTG